MAIKDNMDWDIDQNISQLNGIYVKVKNNDINRALKQLKKKMYEENILKELQKREYYLSKSQKKKRKRNEALRRYKKMTKKQNKLETNV